MGKWFEGNLKMRTIRVLLLAMMLPGVVPIFAGPGTASIVPGVSIFGIALGPDGAQELKKLGKPYRIDSGMSQRREVWKLPRPGDRFDTLFIHTVNNGAIDAQPADGVTIDLIRTTAIRFKTEQGIGVGSTLQQIRKSFPEAGPVDGVPTILDDVKRGIAFEFSQAPSDQSTSIAIMVHTPGQSNFVTQQQVSEVMANGNTE
jgi:hypothetical protein